MIPGQLQHDFARDKGEDEMGYMLTRWTNDSWDIQWADIDEVEIIGPNGQTCRIDGGDFENILSALCAAYVKGKGR